MSLEDKEHSIDDGNILEIWGPPWQPKPLNKILNRHWDESQYIFYILTFQIVFFFQLTMQWCFMYTLYVKVKCFWVFFCSERKTMVKKIYFGWKL